MTVSILLNRLKALVGCESYKLASGTWRDIDDGHTVRIDWPFVGVATNADQTAVAFVERDAPMLQRGS